jgi:translation elongation factor EF-G
MISPRFKPTWNPSVNFSAGRLFPSRFLWEKRRISAEAAKKREELVEMIAENDEKLMEKYLDKGELSSEEVQEGLKKAVLGLQLFPVLALLCPGEYPAPRPSPTL